MAIKNNTKNIRKTFNYYLEYKCYVDSVYFVELSLEFLSLLIIIFNVKKLLL